MAIGLILAGFTILSSVLIFVFNHKTKRLFSSYYFYLSTASIALIYFLASRWIWDLQAWINQDDQNYLGGLDVIKSKVLLLDMCPFLAVFLSLVLMVDRRRALASVLAYFAIVGAGITIFGQIMFERIGAGAAPGLAQMSWWEYTFFNKLFFLMHFYIFIMALIIILNSPSINWFKLAWAHLYALGYFAYISVVALSLKIDWNVTGIVANDWSPLGQYHVLGAFFNLPWPWTPIVAFSLVWIWIILMMLLRNTMVLDPNYIIHQNIAPRTWRRGFARVVARMGNLTYQRDSGLK